MTSTTSPDDNRQTWLIGFLTLFFLQLLTTWIESIYRMGVIKTSMGNEMAGMLLVFAPLLLVVMPKRLESIAFQLAMALFLAARIAIPSFGVRVNILVAGVGVAAGVVIMILAFSKPSSTRSLAPGVCLGLLGSVALRAWGSSYDLSLGTAGAPIGWGFVAITTFLLLRPTTALPSASSGGQDSHTRDGTESIITSIALSIALFANIAILYWVLSSPAVVSAWSESDYFLNVILLVGGWTLVTWRIEQVMGLSRVALMVWNLTFVGLLVGGIYLHTPAVPTSVATSPVIVGTPHWQSQLPFQCMCLFSPIVLVNIVRIADQTGAIPTRALTIGMVIGLVTLVALTVMAVFTNVWGYVGDVSRLFRGRFYLPFLLAGLLMLLPVSLLGRPATNLPNDWESRRLRIFALLLIGFIAIGGVAIRSQRGDPPVLDQQRLTVLTYNMQLGSEPEGDQNYQSQIELLRQIDADIVGLQESDAARPGGGNVDIARLFGDALGYHIYYGPSTIAGTFGTAMLSRFPLQQTRTIYSYSTKDEAGTAVALVNIDGLEVTVFNSHPAGKDEAKLAHIDDLIESVGQHDSVIAIGDYNMRQNSEQYRRLESVLADSWRSLHPDLTGPQHPTIGVAKGSTQEPIDMTDRIDHIFHSRNFKAVESYYLPSPQSETDHPAHWSVLSWE